MDKKIEFPYDSKIPAFNTLATALDLLKNVPKLEILLENLSQEERDFLYCHPVVQEFDLLPWGGDLNGNS